MQIPASSRRKRGPPYSTEYYSVYVYQFTTCMLPGHRHVICGHPPLPLCYVCKCNTMVALGYCMLILREDKLRARPSAVLIKLTLVLRYTPFTSVCEFLCKTWAHRCHALCAKSTRMALFAKQVGRLSIMTS